MRKIVSKLPDGLTRQVLIDIDETQARLSADKAAQYCLNSGRVLHWQLTQRGAVYVYSTQAGQPGHNPPETC